MLIRKIKNTLNEVLLAVIFIGALPIELFAQVNTNEGSPHLGVASVKEIIGAMTLDEKALILVGAGLNSQAPASNDGMIGDVKGKVQGAAGSTNSLPRYGIPEVIMADGPGGLRIDPIRDRDSVNTYCATGWPVGILLGSSWDTCLVSSVSSALANEAKEYGVDAMLAPGMNLIRNPLNGRNFEYFSEDPVLSGRIGGAYVKGVQDKGIGCCVKHFVANNQESNRLNVDAIVSIRALRELYLRGFEIAVKESNPWLVMTSYNKVNGTYTAESYDLLTAILRKDWGYKGCVITDWGGGRDDVQQMWAGNDLIMPGADVKRQAIVDAVRNGSLDEKDLDRNLENILEFILKTPAFKNYRYSDSPDLESHARLARKAAAESIVLLKNGNNCLPLLQSSKIAMFGCASYDTFAGGTGSGEVYTKYKVSINIGLKNASYQLDNVIEEKYYAHIEKDKIDFPRPKKTLGKVRTTPELPFSDVEIEAAAEANDIAIYTIGRQAGEGKDVDVDEGFNLNTIELQQIQKIAKIFHTNNKKLIVIINSGTPIETASWREYVDAVILPWLPGQEAGNAIADIISGKVNPSGKLPVTFPVNYEDIASSKNFPGTPDRRPKQVVYEEGIYVGYRYLNSFNVKPAYEFGYGVSYTNFKYSGIKLSGKKFRNELEVEVTITNSGKVAGREVVQLYLSAPDGKLEKPAVELKGFAKTNLLASGESQTLSLKLNAMDLASFDTKRSLWIAEPGVYKVRIGASSQDFRLEGSFDVKKEIQVEKVNKALVPHIAINKLTRTR